MQSSHHHHHHQTRIEQFCLFVEEKIISTSLSALASGLESQFEHVWSEFASLATTTTTSSSSSATSSFISSDYCTLLADATNQMISMVFSQISAEQDTNINQHRHRIFKVLLCFLSLTEFYVPLSDVSLQHKEKIMNELLLADDDNDYDDRSEVDPSHQIHHLVEILQRQTAVSLSSTVSENFRVPANVFDPRKALEEVRGVLSQVNTSEIQEISSPITSSESGSKNSGPVFVHHLKTILPFTNEGSRLMYDQIPMWCQVVIDESSKLKTTSKTPMLISQIATCFEQLISDLTNLLYRASAQTPQNSPNCAFLTFLICDVSFHLAPIWSLSLQQRRMPSSSSSSRLEFLLFSSAKLFPSHLSSSTTSSSVHDRFATTTKFEVALGCALDCLYGDIEAAVAECCCNRLENGSFEGSSSPSSAMMQLLTTVVHPILCVFRFHQNHHHHRHRVEVESGKSWVSDVRVDILRATLRIICSYWMRKHNQEKDTTGARTNNASINKLNGNASSFSSVVSSDLRILFGFCRRSLMLMNETSDEDQKKRPLALENVIEWFEKRCL